MPRLQSENTFELREDLGLPITLPPISCITLRVSHLLPFQFLYVENGKALEYMINNILSNGDNSVICLVLEYLNQVAAYVTYFLCLKYLDILLG